MHALNEGHPVAHDGDFYADRARVVDEVHGQPVRWRAMDSSEPLPQSVSQDLVPAPVDPRRRSVVSFAVAGDPWPTIASWAREHQFLPRQPQTGNVKLFQKGSGFLTAAMRVQFTQQGTMMELQAWLPISLFARIGALFMLPSEMNIGSGGFRAVIPRHMARKAVNELLARLGAPLIP